MSIIYDALKKIENKNKVENKDRQQTAPSKKKNKNIFILMLLITVFCVLLIDLTYRQLKKSYALKQKKIQEALALQAQKLQNKPKAAEGIEKKLPENLNLEGIIYEEKEPLAVINGRILKVKDKIEDLEIVNITPNSVELINTRDNSKVLLDYKQ